MKISDAYAKCACLKTEEDLVYFWHSIIACGSGHKTDSL